MNWQRLAAFFSLVTALSACEAIDEPVSTSGDGATLNDDASSAAQPARETQQASATTHVQLAEFEGTVSEDGTFDLRLLDVSEWSTPIEYDADLELRGIEQALWCPIRVTRGAPETVVLTTDAGSIGATPGSCGLPATFPYSTLGAFCANVTARSVFDGSLNNVQAEVVSVTPSVGYNGYTFAVTGGAVGTDPLTLTGTGAPTGTLGIFGHGDLALGDSGESQWVFENAGGTFSFRGRVIAEVEEICGDGFDNDCDGELDEVCAPEGSACLTNEECLSGNCELGFCAASTCENGIFDAATETDIDCGASCDAGCANGLVCAVDGDCDSRVCLDNVCAPFDRPGPADLAISEWMANPDGTDTDAEYFELYNAGPDTYDLIGCTISDLGGDNYLFTTSTPVAPGYFALAQGADLNGIGDATYSAFFLSNGDDEIILTCDGQIVDQIAYLTTTSGVATQVDHGSISALLNDDPANLCDTPSNLYAGINLGTPGLQNESCPVFGLTIGDYCALDAVDAFTATQLAALRAQASLSIAGLTDASTDVDTNPQITMQIGFGPAGFAQTDPAWTWVSAAPADGWQDSFGVDGYTATLTLPTAGNYVLAARVTTDNFNSFTYCDRRTGPAARGSEDGFSIADATAITVAAATVATPAAGDLILTEILPNAVNSYDEISEFFELYNATANELDLAGCEIQDNTNTHVIDSSLRIAAGGYIAITRAGSFDENYGLQGDYNYASEFNLSNSGDLLRIVCGGITIDEVDWSADGDFDVEGFSNQLMVTRNDATSNDALTSWCLTPAANLVGDGTHIGTPGAANVACATIDLCQLVRPANLSGIDASSVATVTAQLVSAGLSDLTTGTDENPAVVLEAGVGPDGDDPTVTDAAWTFYPLSADPLWTDAGAGDVDQYTGDIVAPSTGLTSFDYIVRVSADAGLNWTYCDSVGIAAPYSAANAGQGDTLEVFDFSADSCDVQALAQGFAGVAADVSVLLDTAQALGVAPPGAVIAEIGYAPFGTDAAASPGAVTWTSAAFDSSLGSLYDFIAPIVPPTAFDANLGMFDLAARISGDGGATWLYCDANGAPYAAADNGVLDVLTAVVDLAIFDINTAASATEFTQATFGMQWASTGLTDATDGVDQSDDVVIEVGVGSDGVDPEANPGLWTWAAATPIVGWNDATGFDGYEATVNVGINGEYDTAFRISTDAGTTFVYVDTAGNATFSPAAVGSLTSTADPNPPCLVFAEVLEGSSNNKGFEVYNCGTDIADLSVFSVGLASNADTQADSSTVFLPVPLLAGDVYTICNAGWALGVTCDQQGTPGDTGPVATFYNGDDRLVIYRDLNGNGISEPGEPIYDAFGRTDTDPGPSSTWGEQTWRRLVACTYYDGQSDFLVTDYFSAGGGQNDISNFGIYEGCVDYEYYEDFEAGNGGWYQALGTVAPAAGVASYDPSFGAGLFGLSGAVLDCSAEAADLELTFEVVTDCVTTASVDVQATTGVATIGTAAITGNADGTYAATIPNTAGVSGFTVQLVTGSGEACTYSLESVGSSCPLAVPAVAAGDLVINEIDADGVGTAIEVYNSTGASVDMLGSVLEVDGNSMFVNAFNLDLVGATSIAAGGYGLFDNDGANSPVVAVFGNAGPISLTNASSVSLIVDGVVIDSVSLDGGVTFPVGAGANISLDPTRQDTTQNDSGSSWCDDAGSLGSANNACVLGATPTPGDVLITEFSPTPVGDEFIELHNTTGVTVDLTGCTLSDSGASRIIGTDGAGSTTIAPGDYWVIVPDAASVTDNNGVDQSDYLDTTLFGLGGGGDEITLACGGVQIASITFVGGFPTPWGYDTGVASQLDPAFLNASAAPFADFWCGAVSSYFTGDGSTTEFGTPGAANDTCGVAAPGLPTTAGDLVITEVLYDVDGTEGTYEWFELYNATSTLFDLNGLVVADNAASFTVAATLYVGPGEYVVFGADAGAVEDGAGNSLVDYVYAAALTLGNSGDEITVTAGATEITSLVYDGGTNYPDPTAQSLTLDPAYLTEAGVDDGSRWCADDVNAYAANVAAGNNFGTPGAANYDCPGVVFTPPSVIITEIADPLNDTSARFIELYNNSGATVDLSSYALRRWTNANAAPSTDVVLSGSVADGETFVVCNNAATFDTVYAPETCDQNIGTGGPADSNGDDNMALVYSPTDQIVDIFGVPGEDGTGTAHDFADGRALRSCAATTGAAVWSALDWTTTVGGVNAPGGFDPGVWNCGGGFAAPAVDELIITEFQAIPGVANGEWVEIHNLSATETFELSGLIVRTSNGADSNVIGTDGTVQTSTLIGPSGYYIVASHADAVTDGVGASLVDYVWANGDLDDASDTLQVVLADATTVVTELTYGGTYSLVAGDSTSIDPAQLDNAAEQDGAFWCSDDTNAYFQAGAAGLTGTPGAANIDCPGIPAVGGGTLLLSEVSDNGTATLRYAEVYNASAATIDLSTYDVQLYSNGSPTTGVTRALSGTLAPGGVYLICGNAAVASTFGVTCDDTFGSFSANGDDVYALRNGGTVIDTHGVIGVDGTGEPWEFVDTVVERNCAVTDAVQPFAVAEWTYTAGSGAGIGSPGTHSAGGVACP